MGHYLNPKNKARNYNVSFSEQFEDEVRSRFMAFTSDIAMSNQDRRAVSISLSEMTLNAIEHSKTADNQVLLQFELHQDRLMITVQDHGGQAPGPNLDKPRKSFRGNGFKVIKALCDRVEIFPSKAGFRIAITKNLWRPQIGGFSL
ncbi:MAG: hypothetical protein COY19_01935 [Candidatus Marinimicrobia bacterium CG_4_10_14_0_2_um_filter_48_9]|nr:MAG: hypothetical protein COY19_01935 [Candidatus Marinimicrobia bacterium CG_4_10_14_0_2_um_filter_48_9]PJA54167.1 MAG: hypothetical protein CO167_05305 [Candidatus Marinimicrobia bacterium CG_4_9_14_3_um_filter_48_9]